MQSNPDEPEKNPESDEQVVDISHQPAADGIAARAIAAQRPVVPTNDNYFEGLNDSQKTAVETLDGPLLVLAGAGTGKTRVLTTRIAHILATKQAFPGQILAVTFTNKAAREMKGRIANLVGEDVEGMPWLGTFHSICTKILRIHAELVGLNNGFTIIDATDQLRLIKQLLQAENFDEKRWPPRTFAYLLDKWKNRGQFPKDISEQDSYSFGNGQGKKLYESYQKRLQTLNAVDFGDLLLLTLQLFKENADILKKFQNRFRYMLVDEYQDTNVAQYLWLRLLAQGNKNICCVGDEDQSIYGWRGAEVDNILRFERDFPGAVVVRLERNYRSTGHILAAASNLIAHNKERLGKTLYTEDSNEDSEMVSVANSWDSQSEAREIGDEIEALQTHGHTLNEMAILVRASHQMREFEDRFVTLGLDYRVIGGPRFYERMEIRDALAYFRVTVQPADDIAFERIINTPKRGLGPTTVNLLHKFARDLNLPLTAATREVIETSEIRTKARNTLKKLLDDFDRWRSQLDHLTHKELAEIILDESGYTAMWKNDRSADASGRLENLKELVRSMEEFESMQSFLEHVMLVMDRDSVETRDAVNLMTMHAAKGLEFDTVFLPGWEEGLFPSQRSLDESGMHGLEEERRLAYVALTRAKKRINIWFCSNRQLYGSWQNSTPSRFIDELPESHIEVRESNGSYGGYATSRFDKQDPFESSYQTPGWQRAQRNSGAKSETQTNQSSARSPGVTTIEGELVARTIGTGEHQYSVGDRVFHEKFGTGSILEIEGNKLFVNFKHSGRKKVISSYVRPA